MQKIVIKRIIYFSKIIVTILIMYIIFRKIDLTAVFNNFLKISLVLLLFLLITAVLKVFLYCRNWGRYLHLEPDYRPEKGEICRSFFVGQALRFLLPGGYGVVGKMYFVNNKKKSTLISIGLEKFIQIWTAFFFAAFAAIFYFKAVPFLIKLLIFLIILSAPFLVQIIPDKVKRSSLKAYIHNYKKSIITILITQIIYMLITLVQYYLLIRYFNDVSFFSVVIAVPIILTANLIPITYAGLGFKETFAIEILSHYDIPAEIAVTCTLMIFFINTALPGLAGLYFIVRKK